MAVEVLWAVITQNIDYISGGDVEFSVDFGKPDLLLPKFLGSHFQAVGRQCRLVQTFSLPVVLEVLPEPVLKRLGCWLIGRSKAFVQA
ncbi:hypothetical protein GGQ18_001809 [Salinibacter ruber]|uniref:hypothetical protein n=1 Tax=Salinibacter ruber TaxID=146919 RepID=UPI0018523033|nr:hypothetical protein [Salinibacter ruber]MBB4069225.1 hypothetical protein [Salinibacter ruber]